MRPTLSSLAYCQVGGTTYFLTLALYIPFAQQMFHFAPLHSGDLALSLLAGAASMWWYEGVKRRRRTSQTYRSASVP
jgi:hypothetical protein